jgi:hypothetical protein
MEVRKVVIGDLDRVQELNLMLLEKEMWLDEKDRT